MIKNSKKIGLSQWVYLVALMSGGVALIMVASLFVVVPLVNLIFELASYSLPSARRLIRLLVLSFGFGLIFGPSIWCAVRFRRRNIF